MGFIRTHMSDVSELDPDKQYAQSRFPNKPIGLWYSFDVEWLIWCCNNVPERMRDYFHVLEVDISDFVVIRDYSSFDLFVKEYSIPFEGCELIKEIDWGRVKKDYKGIEIQNYSSLNINSHNSIGHLWFNAWDVPRGCIWDLSALKDSKVESTEDILKNFNLE